MKQSPQVDFSESLRTGKRFPPGFPCPWCGQSALLEAAGAWWSCTACLRLRTRFRRLSLPG